MFKTRWLWQFVLVLLLLVACGGGEEEASPTAPVGPTLTPTTGASEPTPTPEPTETTAATAITQVATGTAELATPTTEPTQAATETAPAPAGAPADSITAAPVAEGLARPTYLTHAGDERLFVTEQRGRIRLIEGGQLLPNPFLDITERVGLNASEQGLLSVAFHPDYAENGFFYVNYTDANGDTVVSRFQVGDDPNQADPNSEHVILTVDQPYGNHNGGQLKFGPDGYLYIGMGDGGSAGDPHNNGQDPNTLLGDLLRLDVDNGGDAPYAIPPDNPYVNGGGRPEVWAIGLRNPWRFSFDRQTQDLYVADVGQNEFEEINFVPAGQGGGVNYGWNIMEGLHCYANENCNQEGLHLPVAEYSHAVGGCSVTGGYVYRGARFPELTGNYFYADYCSGYVWSLYRLPDGQWDRSEQLIATVEGNISSFGEDVNGELYVVTHEGTIYQIQP